MNAFSQSVTLSKPTQVRDSIKITLTKPIARLVIKDLVQYDGLTVQVQTMESLLQETNNKLLVQTDLVSNLELQLSNSGKQITALEEQFRLEVQLRNEFEKVLKREKRKSTIYKVGTMVGAAATLLLLAK